MKKIKSLFMGLAIGGFALGLMSCSDGNAYQSGSSSTTPESSEVKNPESSSTDEATTPESVETTTPESTTTPSESQTVPSTTVPTTPEAKPENDLASKYDCISIKEAKEIAKENDKTKRYYIYGEVVSITNPEYGAMIISDGVDELEVYGSYSADGKLRYKEMTNRPAQGDEVVLYANLNLYKEKPQVYSGWITEFKHNEVEIDPNEYVKTDLATARTMAKGSKVVVSGVVASVTLTQGKVPNGVIIVDETGSMFIHGELAGQVKVGNTIELLGTKDYFVQAKEQEYATKFGYMGANQLTNTRLISNDNKVSDFKTTGIPSETIKNIKNTPLDMDITGKLYKSNAVIKKVPGNGFTNYYINDLDGKTGSYVYSSNNGNDFSWLDEYLDKLVTVYFTPINCKSTPSGCFYRFLPVKVMDEGFTFDKANAADFVKEYYIENQFDTLYKADPALDLITTLRNDLINISATISYQSDNEDVIYFENNADLSVMHTKNVGKANIKAIITAEGKTVEFTTTIEVKALEVYNSISVLEAVNTLDKTEVIVKGVAGPSLAVRTGFYLIDETGIIAVYTDEALMKEIKLGDEIILKATRDHIVDENKKDTLVGQSVLKDAVLLANSFGEHEYSKASFKTATISELKAKADMKVDETTVIYKVKAKVEVSKSSYSTNIYLHDLVNTGDSIRLYAKNASVEFDFLMPLDNQEVELELALCNWNNKTYYTACVISANANGNIIYNTHFYL